MSSSLDIQIEATRDRKRVRLTGSINEHTDFEAAAIDDAATVVLDLGEVERINSVGVRHWVQFLADLRDSGCAIMLERCSPVLVQQFNMISSTHQGVTIRSVLLPYQCEACGHFEARCLQITADADVDLAEHVPCPECSEMMFFDDLPDLYLNFLDT